MAGVLILCATPIGNLGDAPPRLAEALASAHVVFAEDTRRSEILLRNLAVDSDVRSYFAGNEEARAGELEKLLVDGRTVALVTDAGTPSISDPGVSAVAAARNVGATVTIVPGPSAVTAALAVSGFPADRFAFEGFLPRKQRWRRLDELRMERRTLVLFASPHRLGEEMEALAAALGDERPVCVVRELTKLHEEVWWGTLGEAVRTFGGPGGAKGEVTLVVAPPESAAGDVADAVRAVNDLVEDGMPLAAAVKEVSLTTGLSRRLLYEAALRSRGDNT